MGFPHWWVGSLGGGRAVFLSAGRPSETHSLACSRPLSPLVEYIVFLKKKSMWGQSLSGQLISSLSSTYGSEPKPWQVLMTRMWQSQGAKGSIILPQTVPSFPFFVKEDVSGPARSSVPIPLH